MRVKYLAQEYNAVPRPGLEPRPPNPESSALTIRPPRKKEREIFLLLKMSTFLNLPKQQSLFWILLLPQNSFHGIKTIVYKLL